MTNSLWLLLFLLLLSGCAVVRAPKKTYQFLYCQKMNPDGKTYQF